MKKLLFLLFCMGLGLGLQAQDRFWVFLSDKGENVASRLSDPKAFLGEDALERRKQAGIKINESDLPVWDAYVRELQAHSGQVLSRSRWLNAVAVELPENCREEVASLCFVSDLRPVATLVQNRARMTGADLEPLPQRDPRPSDEKMPLEYGEAEMQNSMLNVHLLHNRGFSGRGVRIALFDSGFSGADSIDVFDSLWIQNRIIAWYDFVENDTTVFQEDSHGTQVMSTIAANLPGEMVGTAPHASFILCRTEDARTETRQEENNWVRALEWADSIGVDVIHSSLGYSEFDDESQSYTYNSMDGNTAISTRAADMAAAKGIIVTTSAGNEGYGSWKYITAPCDGDSVLCVGAVTKAGKKSGFSSIGPSADGRVKPDVVALGSRTTVASPGNYISAADGTSFSGPLMGGVVACLRQAHPDRSNMDIIKAVQISGDQYNFPDEAYGYGIPDAALADSLLTHVEDLSAFKRMMAEKPVRGKPRTAAVTAAATLKFADNPNSKVELKGDEIIVTTPSTLEVIEIMRGQQKVQLDPKDITRSDLGAQFSTQYLIPGAYYLHIKTTSYEENVKFSIP